MKPFRFSLKLALTAPLALALAACGGEAGGDLAGDVIAPIAAPDGTNWGETVTVSDADGYVLGNPDAPLKLIEYASHTCGACANFSATAKPGIQEYVATGVVSFEQRNLVRDPIDLTIATLVRCGAKENMQTLSDLAWQNLQETFNNVNANNAAYQAAGELPPEQRFIGIAQAAGLIDFFAARGLSADQARTCLADTDAIDAFVEGSSTKANEAGVTGTPTFTLNGSKVDVNQWPGLEPILQNAGARTE